MATQSSKWTMRIFNEEGGELQVRFEGPANQVKDLQAIEAALRGLNAWHIEPNFKEGSSPKKVKRDWFLPIKKVAAKFNPSGKKKTMKGKATEGDAIDLYRRFNNTEPSEIKRVEVYLPDENCPLVALGEGFCPFIGYSSAKTSKTGDVDKFIHHFGEEGGTKPKVYVSCPPPGYDRLLIIYGGDWGIEERDDGLLWLVN
jgi:hypothetical protein